MGIADYGVRKYDSFTGRFITADVLFEKYPAWNPYHYATNNPISMYDDNGYHVLVAFSGANFSGGNDKAIAGEIVNNIVQYAEDNNISDFNAKAFATDALDPNSNSSDAINFIIDNLDNKDEKVILYGYSAGGIAVENLAEELKSEGINVDYLFTVDAAYSIASPLVDRNISSNVEFNLNFYQTDFSKLISRGNKNSSESTNTIIKNINKLEESHSTIDESTQNQIENEIKAIIKN